MNRIYFTIALVASALFAGAASAAEDSCANWNESTLSGDWGGTRSGLCDKGVTVAFTHKSDLLANTSGGVARGSVVLMHSEAAVSMDLDKLAGWSGTSAFVHYHVQHGNKSINAYTGSFAGVTNIETGASTGQFFQAWVQKNVADDRLSLLAGLYAIDSEFYVNDASRLFLQPPYGMSAEMAQTGKNGPPIFPTGALGIRLKYSGEGYYAQAAVTDGVPGNPNNRQGTQIRFDKGDGTLSIAEFGYTPETAVGQYNKTAIGLWRYSTHAADLLDVDAFGNPVQRIDQGAYALAERTLMAEAGDPAQGLAGFVRWGFVNKNVYQVDWSGSVGLIYQGLFDGRDGDTAGIAITTSHASGKYRQKQWLQNAVISKSHETVVELSYRAQVNGWFALEPTLQYIGNPNMDPALKDAWVAGARFEVVF